MHGNKSDAPVARRVTALAAAIMALGLTGCSAVPERPADAEVATCYATIGHVDCYTTPEPDRHPTGTIANVSGTDLWVSR